MKNKRGLIIGLIILFLVVALPVAWWLGSPLFIDNQVNEAFPFDLPTEAQLAEMPEPEQAAVVSEAMQKIADAEAQGEMTKDEMEEAAGQVEALAASMPDKVMEDEMPEAAVEAEWVQVAQGEFMDADDSHQGSGTATIFQQGDNRVLRFESFESTNGPDLHVLLVENVEGKSSAELGDYVDLGSLKGNIGNQNYEIPADVDLSKYTGIIIYCMPFHVLFSSAAF